MLQNLTHSCVLKRVFSLLDVEIKFKNALTNLKSFLTNLKSEHMDVITSLNKSKKFPYESKKRLMNLKCGLFTPTTSMFFFKPRENSGILDMNNTIHY